MIETGKFFSEIHREAALETGENLNLALKRIGKPREWFKGKTLVDVGCSNGRTLLAFSRLKLKKLCGIEIGLESVRLARKRLGGRAEIRHGSVLDLPYGNGFDVVYCSGIIHHTETPALAVSELARITKPGGILVLGVLNKGGIMRIAIILMRAIGRIIPYRFSRRVLPHIFNKMRVINILDISYAPIQHRFGENEVRDMLAEAGFINLERIRHERYNSRLFGGGFIIIRGREDEMPNLNDFAIHGMHDDAWVKEMRRKYPDSLVFRAMDDPASLTEKEMRLVVSMTGDAGIALRWAKGRKT